LNIDKYTCHKRPHEFPEKFHVTVKSLLRKYLLPDASEHCWYWRQPGNIQTRLHAQVKNFYSLQHIGVKDTYL